MKERAGLDPIKTFEGCKLTAYLCPAGVWTIGWGRTTGVRRGQRITQAQADRWLEEEYDHFGLQVLSSVRVALTDNELGALVSFAYNVGIGAFRSSTLLRLLNAGDYRGASRQFARWNRAGGRVLRGLTRRRAAEAALFTLP